MEIQEMRARLVDVCNEGYFSMAEGIELPITEDTLQSAWDVVRAGDDAGFDSIDQIEFLMALEEAIETDIDDAAAYAITQDAEFQDVNEALAWLARQ